MKRTASSYLYQRQNGTYYFRRAVPEALQPVLGKSEWKVSLRTRVLADALSRCSAWIKKTEQYFEPAIAEIDNGVGSVSVSQLDDDALVARATSRFKLKTRMIASRERARLFLGATSKELPADRLARQQKTLARLKEETPWSNEFDEPFREVATELETEFGQAIIGTRAEMRIRHELWAARVRGYEISIAHLLGDKEGMAELDKISQPRRKTLADLLQRYEKEKSPGWVPKTASKFRTMRALLIELIGERKPLEDIDRELLRDVIDVVEALPPNYTKLNVLSGLSSRAAAEKAKQLGLRRRSRKTVVDYANNLSALFGFAVREDYMDRNPAEKLGVSTPAERTTRRPFSIVEINQLFRAPVFVGCIDDEANWRKPGPSRPQRGRYWVPLIALHSGMRLNEICFLRASDILEIDGVCCIDVNERGGRQLKSRNAERLIPVHMQLEQLGFISWVRRRKELGPDAELFPELPVNSQGYRSDGFSKWFGRLRNSVGVSSNKTTFHSFRHYFKDRLQEALVPIESRARLMGWGGSHIDHSYGAGPSVRLLQAEMQKVSFPGLDLGQIVVGKTTSSS